MNVSALPLVWLKVSSALMRTECGKFRCRRYWTGDDVIKDPGEQHYQLYGPNGMRMGPPTASFDAAKAFAWNESPA